MLHGEHVTLRPVRVEDLHALYANLLDPETWISGSDTPLWPMPFSVYEKMCSTSVGDDMAEFAVEVGGTLIGRGGLFEIDHVSRNASIGLSLCAASRGQGFGRDVVRVLLDYGFQKRNLHRIYLEALARNIAGLRAYAASGFVEEGRLRDSAYLYGGFEDLVVMGVLRSDWLDSRLGSER